MSNTIIQIKRSNLSATPANGSLSAAELAYSYNSDKLFIGNSSGTGVIEVGGKYWLNHTLNAFDRANNGGSGSNAAFAQANAAATLAVGAHALANLHAANLSVAIAANVAAGNSYAVTVGISGNSYTDLTSASSNNWANAVGQAANSHASSTYFTKTGGNISGDVGISGNLTISGTLSYVNTTMLSIGDNILTLNGDLPSNLSPTEDAGLEVNRGILNSNAALLWVESAGKWGFTSNNLTAITKYIASNTDVDVVNNSVKSNWTVTNTIYEMANTAAGLVASGNAYIQAYADAGNNYSQYIGVSGNSYTDQISVSINNWVDILTTAGNNYISSVNDWAGEIANSANIYAEYIGSSSNSLISATNTNIFNTFSNAANLISGTVPSDRISGDYLNITGVGIIEHGTWRGNAVEVFYGGTGQTQFANNGVLFGNTAGSLRVASSTLEGQVLQASAVGTPEFAMLDGGAF